MEHLAFDLTITYLMTCQICSTCNDNHWSSIFCSRIEIEIVILILKSVYCDIDISDDHSLVLPSEDISGIEAGHSSIREFTKQRGRGHMPSLHEVSAKSLCRFVAAHHGHTKDFEGQRQGQGQRDEAQQQQQQQQQVEPPLPGARPVKRTGSGGPWRAFCSSESAGKQLTASSIRELKSKYAVSWQTNVIIRVEVE